MLTIDEIVRRLTDGLFYTKEQVVKIKNWLLEYQTANDLTLKELDDICWEDSNWVFNQIF